MTHRTISASVNVVNEAEQPEKSEQSELDLGVISTGSAEVDAALRPIEQVGDLPVSEHPDVFERVLGDLSATMTDSAAGADSRADA